MIITLTGTNHFLLKTELDKLTKDFIERHTDIGLEKFDGEELSADTLKGAVQSMPFLAEKKLAVVHNAGKEVSERIDDILKAVNETTDLVLVEDKLDKRSSYYKTLKTKTDFREFNELDERGLTQWLVDRAKHQKGSLSSADARYLIQRVGPNQMLLASELDKLLLYESTVSRRTIDLLTELTPQSTIFELLDAAFAGNQSRAIALYHDQRQQKVEPLQILAMIAWQLHVLALIKTAGQRTPDQIASEAKVSPYVLRKSQSIARKLSLSQLKGLIHQALDLDIRLKSENLDADEALQYFLLRLGND